MFRQAKPKAEAKKVEEQIKAAEAPLMPSMIIPRRYGGGIRITEPVTKAYIDSLMTSDLLPVTAGLYSLGSIDKGWLRAVFEATDAVNGFFGRVCVGGKFPAGAPYEVVAPFISFDYRSPSGPTTCYYEIYAHDTELVFRGYLPNLVDFIDFITFNTITGELKLVPAGGSVKLSVLYLDTLGSIYSTPFVTVTTELLMYDDMFIQIAKPSSGTLPAPDESYRGKIIRVEGGEGVADKFYMCMKSAADTYSWVQIISG